MQLMSAEQIAPLVGVKAAKDVTDRFRRNGILPVQREGRTGLYNLEVIKELYKIDLRKVERVEVGFTDAERKGRNDAGVPRGKNAELVHYVSMLARNYFLADGDAVCVKSNGNRPKGVMAACRAAVEQMQREFNEQSIVVKCNAEDVSKITVQWLYSNWVTRRDTENHKNTQPFIGAYWRDDWEGEWMRVWRKHDVALNRGGVRYRLWKLLENDFECGAGNGFGRYVFLDDRVSKVFVNVGTDTPQKVTGICAWDVLTGVLLHVEPCEEVTTQAYVRTVLAVVFKFGCDRTTWFLENAKTAIADRLRNLIRSLYSTDDMAWFQRKEHRQTFAGQDYIVRNVPAIPHAIGKGAGEALNAALRDLDGVMFPRAFVGTERSQAVQLQRSNSAVRKNEIAPTLDEYFNALVGAAWTELMNREMPTRRDWAKEKNLPATRSAMMLYYMPDVIKRPDESKLAMLLYFAQPHTPSRVKLQNRGTLRITINGVEHNIKHPMLYDSTLDGYYLSAVELPWKPGHFALYKRYKETVTFLCVAEDYTVTTAHDATRMRNEVRAMREADDVVTVTIDERVSIANERAVRAIEAGKVVRELTAQVTPELHSSMQDDDVIIVNANAVVSDNDDITANDIDDLLNEL